MKYRLQLLLGMACTASTINVNAETLPSLSVSDTQPTFVSTVTPLRNQQKVGAGSMDEENVYIVQMSEAAVASYTGGINGLAATSPRITGAQKLDTKNLDSQRYATFLLEKQKTTQAHCEQAFGRKLEVKFNYQLTFNGMAMKLTADEAAMIADLPEVIKVTKEKIHRTMTDVGPEWIGADAIREDSYFPYYRAGTKGEGIVVAIFDTGINSQHPSFADIGGDGYDHKNPLGSGNYIPGSHCDTVDPDFCNDKLIGAWGFTKGPTDPGSPEDSDGHGSHVASTAAGNIIEEATLNAPTSSLTRAISGVAPHANIIAYDVCNNGCPGSALLAAIEQVVKDAAVLPDGIHALNYSISGGDDPYNDPVELGFLNASAAGIFVSAAGGNSGPDAATVAHNSAWVTTVAATTHNRVLENSLVGLTSDGQNLSDITSVGFTTGYGPAPIIHARDYPTDNGSKNDTEPGQCLDPFPPGHFNGEIVICDRGTIARTAKGDNILAGGAGGYVLANDESNGESVTGDAHSLPAVHVGFTDGEILRAWTATEENTMASISGAELNLDPSNGDLMAGFSSRGPNLSSNVLKPDVGAPGVGIFAAIESDGEEGDDYGFLSGTSMAAPHNTGAAALISAARPEWSPFELKSALMMTAKNLGNFKEDGFTPADPFDLGAGRIDLTEIVNTGLVLNETPENFLAADPAQGGDTKTLNIPSMKDNNCVGNCSWTRTVTSASKKPMLYKLSVSGPDGLDLHVKPKHLVVLPGQSKEITVSANTTLADAGWNFAELELNPWGSRRGPDLHMPIAIKPSTSSDANLFSKTVDKAEAKKGEVLSYNVTITNGPITDVLNFVDELPSNLRIVPDSLTSQVSKGTELSPFEYSGGQLHWSGTLDEGGLRLKESPSPFGYFPLASLGIEPYGCPEDNCDDGGVVLNVPAFNYNGESYSQVVWSINGTLQAGAGDGQAASASTQSLPNEAPPNNLLAPFWTDLDMGEDGDGAEWYIGVLNAGESQFTVYEWNNIPLFGNKDFRYTFQIWVENGSSGNIWFVYQDISSAEPPSSGVSVGLENSDGTVGDSYFYAGEGSTPTPGVDLQVEQLEGGSATFGFQAKVKYCKRSRSIVNRAYLDSVETENTAIAVTRCIK